jgi:hypothetical protein
MHVDIVFITLIALTYGVCGLALWKGEAAERWGAGLFLLSTALESLAQTFKIPDFPMIELVGDGLTAIGLLVLLMIYGRLWLGAAMLFQAAQFTLHSFYLVTEREHDAFHVVVNNVNFMGLVLSIAVGAAMSIYRRSRARRAAANSAA